jgi:hypothetical protein
MRPGAHWNATFLLCYSFVVRLAALHRLSRDLRMGWQQRSFSAIFSRHQCTRSLERQLSGILRFRGFHWYAWLARYLQKRGYLQNTHNIYLWRQGLSAISPGHPTSLLRACKARNDDLWNQSISALRPKRIRIGAYTNAYTESNLSNRLSTSGTLH